MWELYRKGNQDITYFQFRGLVFVCIQMVYDKGVSYDRKRMTMMIIGNCPLCKRRSLTSVEEREVIGVTTCKKTGNKSVVTRRSYSNHD